MDSPTLLRRDILSLSSLGQSLPKERPVSPFPSSSRSVSSAQRADSKPSVCRQISTATAVTMPRWTLSLKTISRRLASTS
jgi:hypothetical protein